jgi:hypothetical protein
MNLRRHNLNNFGLKEQEGSLEGGHMARKFTSKDFEEHERTYSGFVQLVKWSTIATVVVVIALYFAIQP